MSPPSSLQSADPRYELTQRLLPLLLAGTHPRLLTLREQLQNASALVQSETNWGFYAKITVADSVRRVEPSNFCGGNAVIEVQGLRIPAGCILYVENGVLSFLEVYTCDEPWEHPPVFLSVSQVEPIVPGENAPPNGA
jgi:hypothetical protein